MNKWQDAPKLGPSDLDQKITPGEPQLPTICMQFAHNGFIFVNFAFYFYSISGILRL